MRKILENKIFKFFYGIIKGFIVTFITLYLIFVIFQRVTNNSSIFGYRVFTIATGSMEPVYNVNDVILVEEYDPNKLKVGDDIAYVGKKQELEGLIITHRIVKIEKNEKGETEYTLKGVNNKYEDPSITKDQILGKVRGKVYIINFINHVIKNIYGFFFLVFCPLVLVIFLEIADTIIAIKVDKNELKLVEKGKKKKTKKCSEDDNNDEEII